jgi:hypothetical protein
MKTILSEITKGGARPIPVERLLSRLAAVLLGLALLHTTALAQQPTTSAATPAPGAEPLVDRTPHHPDELSRLREEWTPPGDDPQASGSGDARGFLAHYFSTKSLPDVWVHYATKLGLTARAGAELRYQPNANTQVFPRLGPRVTDGHATLTIKNIQFPNQTEGASTLIRQEPDGRTVTVCLASEGERTLVFVMVVPGK